MEKNNLFGKNDVAKNSFKINNYDQVPQFIYRANKMYVGR